MKRQFSKSRPVIWAFFSSVKLTVALLIILAMASVVGTLIPQTEGVAEFAKGLSPAVRKLFVFFDLFDVYHSLWFRILMGALTLNIVICSLDRFQGTWKRFTARPRPDREKPFQDIPGEQTFVIDSPPADMAERVHDYLAAKYRKMRAKEVGTEGYFYAERGGYSLFGVYLVHMSVLCILVGGLVGSFLGFEAYVNIVEGESVNTVVSRKERSPIELGFEVRCDNFTVDFYENGTPKEYRTEVTFSADGKRMKQEAIRVNHPAVFQGVTFYQSNYGTVPGNTVHLSISSQGGGPGARHMKVEPGKPYSLPGGEGTFSITDLRTNIMDIGPAAMVSVKPEHGQGIRFWVFKYQDRAKKILPGPMLNSPKFNASAFEPYTFTLAGLDTRYYTGLQANKDPGVPVVWIGFFLMVAGLFVTFFISHRRIWVKVSQQAQGLVVSVAGTSNKNPVGLQREVNTLTLSLKNLLQGDRQV
ncbi:MAG: cytochrome c biogenesis protein ResB [Desulfatiglandaceae bacterium]